MNARMVKQFDSDIPSRKMVFKGVSENDMKDINAAIGSIKLGERHRVDGLERDLTDGQALGILVRTYFKAILDDDTYELVVRRDFPPYRSDLNDHLPEDIYELVK